MSMMTTIQSVSNSNRQISRWKRIVGSWMIFLFTISMIVISVVNWMSNNPTWDIELDSSGPQHCAEGQCWAWRIDSSANSIAQTHDLTTEQYVCGFDGQSVSAITAASKIDHSYELLISSQPSCQSLRSESLISDVISLPTAIVDWLITAMCGILGTLIYRHATQRRLVGPMIALLASLVIAFSGIPGNTNQPITQELSAAAASGMVPPFLWYVMVQTLLPIPKNRVSRLVVRSLPIFFLVGICLFVMNMLCFYLHASAFYILVRSFRTGVTVILLLSIIFLIVNRNFTTNADYQRDYARILGGGILVAVIPMLICGLFPIIFHFSPIFSIYEAIISFLAIPLTLAYVILRRDLLQVDSLIRWAVSILFSTSMVFLILTVCLSIFVHFSQIQLEILAPLMIFLLGLVIIVPSLFRLGRWITELWLFPEMTHYRHILAKEPEHIGTLSPADIGEGLLSEIMLAFPINDAAVLVLDESQSAFVEVAHTSINHGIKSNTPTQIIPSFSQKARKRKNSFRVSWFTRRLGNYRFYNFARSFACHGSYWTS
jgi:hypothetical protein